MNEGSHHDQGVLLASRFASEVKSRWRRGEHADVAAVLEEYPELKQHKSVVLDLACSEYFQRLDQGEPLDAETFSSRFPAFQRSLFLLIEVQRMLGHDASFSAIEENVPWPELGEDFLGFSLRAELGRGTFARVFLASQPALGDRPVALKVAWQGGKEAEVLGRLRHPNIVPVYSVQEDPETGLTAVCMPYLGRATLGDVLDRAFADSRPPTRARVVLEAIANLHDTELAETASPDRILRTGSYVDGVIHLAVQLADALAYTHARGICHHDLKPPNVLISTDGRPLLLDFNLSFDERTNASRFGGTIPYMAPEQLRLMVLEPPDCPGHADPRSDLFSLGVILYEMLSGALPFGLVRWSRSLEETARLLAEQQAKGPQPLREKNRQVDSRLAQTIEKCLALDPDCRPQSAAALGASLRNHLAPIRRSRRWVGHHRKPVLGILLTLLALALCWGVFLAFRPPYNVRQLRRGLEYYDLGKYELAIESFDKAIRAAPEDSGDTIIARGRTYLKLNDPRMAFGDFHAAFAQQPSGDSAAGMGYCLSQLRYHKEAIEYYQVAASMGDASAALFNDIGYTCLQLNRLEDAERFLKQATRLDGESQAAHHNLATLYLRQALTGRTLSAAAHVHVLKAIEIGPPSADLYSTAALICLLAAKHDTCMPRRAVSYLEKAHSLGLDVGTMKPNPLFRPLRDLREFKRLLSTPPGVKPVPSVLLVDPL